MWHLSSLFAVSFPPTGHKFPSPSQIACKYAQCTQAVLQIFYGKREHVLGTTPTKSPRRGQRQGRARPQHDRKASTCLGGRRAASSAHYPSTVLLPRPLLNQTCGKSLQHTPPSSPGVGSHHVQKFHTRAHSTRFRRVSKKSKKRHESKEHTPTGVPPRRRC